MKSLHIAINPATTLTNLEPAMFAMFLIPLALLALPVMLALGARRSREQACRAILREQLEMRDLIRENNAALQRISDRLRQRDSNHTL